ncbi:uncharacterized protein LOC134344148 [Mobula hypostoma]|uniref:uncharacterized protein LOC134344148 n=1 Tax=Mobula hypostoma TaxID=723540 RepID=UPI002FC368F2
MVCLNGVRWFDVLDLRSGCCQNTMSEVDKEKTAIIGPLGFFRSKKMPQGISGSPATFLRGMGKTMGDVEVFGVLAYVDDCLGFGFALGDDDVRRVPEPRTTNEDLEFTLVKVQTGKQNSKLKLWSCNDELIQRDETMTSLQKDEQKLKTSIQNRLEEAGGVTASQMEMDMKRGSELLRLGRELEESEKRLTSRLQEAEETAEAAQAKCFSLEKIKQQLPIERMWKNMASKDDVRDVWYMLPLANFSLIEEQTVRPSLTESGAVGRSGCGQPGLQQDSEGKEAGPRTRDRGLQVAVGT